MALASHAARFMSPRIFVPLVARQYRYFEPELRHLDEFVPPDRAAVDVGVWWGPWTYLLAKRVPRVDSFEPNPDLVSALTEAMPANVHLHGVALGDIAGEAGLWIPPGGVGTEGRATLEAFRRPATGGRMVSVQTERLDSFQLHDVGFIKIDVEGHEFAVLRGAVHLLETQHPNLMIEIEHRSHDDTDVDEIITFLAERGYVGRFLHRGTWHPLTEFDRNAARALASRVARHGYATNLVLYARRFVHNFLFTAE
jgi:FkbM family methyltransferase